MNKLRIYLLFVLGLGISGVHFCGTVPAPISFLSPTSLLREWRVPKVKNMHSQIKARHLINPSEKVHPLWDAYETSHTARVKAGYLYKQFQRMQKKGFLPKAFDEVVLLGAGNGIHEIQALIVALKRIGVKPPSVIHIVDPNPHKENLIRDSLKDKDILKMYPELIGPDAPKEIRFYPIKAQYMFYYIKSSSVDFVTGFNTVQNDIMNKSEQQLTALAVWRIMKSGGIFTFPGDDYVLSIMDLVPEALVSYNSQYEVADHPFFVKKPTPFLPLNVTGTSPNLNITYLFQKCA